MRIRWPAAAATLVLIAGGLTGCTVAANGVTGVTRDTDGNLVAVVAWCGRQPDALTLYHDVGEREVLDADYVAPLLPGSLARFRLDGSDPRWHTRSRVPALRASIDYALYGNTRDSRVSTTHVDFRIRDVPAGSILAEGVDGRAVHVTNAGLRRLAHQYCLS